MSSEDEYIARLRRELAALHGPARLQPLLGLGRVLFMRSWRRVGLATARSDLDEAIEAYSEAYGYLAHGDHAKAAVGAQLGLQLSLRHTAHTGTAQDRDAAIRVLEDAVSFPQLAPALRGVGRFALSTCYLSRGMQALTTGGISLAAFQNGIPPAFAADADRAETHLRALQREPMSEEIAEGARFLLSTIEMMRKAFGSMHGGGLAIIDDFQGLVAGLSELQKLKDGMLDSTRFGAMLAKAAELGVDSIVDMDPLDRPVTLAQGAGPIEDYPVPEPAPAIEPDADALRRALGKHLAAMSNPDIPATAADWERGIALLRPSGPAPGVAAVDDLVALTTALVEAEPPADRTLAGLDHFLAAVALYLRDKAGADHLLAATRALPMDHPAFGPVLGTLGAFLDAPGDLTELADSFATQADAFIVSGHAGAHELVVAHALRCVCRAPGADPDEVTRAVGTLPTDYPWRETLIAAAKNLGCSGQR